MNKKKEVVINYALTFIGTPYLYGGNSALVGLDCSGFICELLKSVGIIGSHRDLSSGEIRKELLASGGKSIPGPETGAILFFGKSKNMISHVAIALDDVTMVESGGGGASTVTRKAAEEQNAMVRIRPVRKDLVDTVMPIYD